MAELARINRKNALKKFARNCHGQVHGVLEDFESLYRDLCEVANYYQIKFDVTQSIYPTESSWYSEDRTNFKWFNIVLGKLKDLSPIAGSSTEDQEVVLPFDMFDGTVHGLDKPTFTKYSRLFIKGDRVIKKPESVHLIARVIRDFLGPTDIAPGILNIDGNYSWTGLIAYFRPPNHETQGAIKIDTVYHLESGKEIKDMIQQGKMNEDYTYDGFGIEELCQQTDNLDRYMQQKRLKKSRRFV